MHEEQEGTDRRHVYPGGYMFWGLCVLPQLVEAQIQPSSEMAICVTQEVWNVLTVMSDEGKLLDLKKKERNLRSK